MGCHSSKQARRGLLRSPSPLPRSKSLPDNRHAVSLTSSTLGSLNLHSTQDEEEEGKKPVICGDIGLAEARAWSELVQHKIPRTPTETPPNEPEPIDALELMAGFHGDYSPLDRRSFSFYPISHLDTTCSAADPATEPDSTSESASSSKWDAVVFYFTSLRGIRKTYDDCYSVRAILREYCVRVDERDVSMHGGFREELKEMAGDGSCALPRVLVDGRDLGGAEEVKRMHERGELGKVFEGCAKDTREEGAEAGEECEACGDVRFVVCGHCSGSSRVYVDDDEEEEEVGGGGWRRCSDCNENGIVRCPVCC